MSKIGVARIGELAPGEKLFIQRRRLNETQQEAAARFGVSYVTYNQWENDKSGSIPDVKISELATFECCLLCRRRAKIRQSVIARGLSVSRWWLSQMERGTVPCHSLAEYWGI